MSALDRTLLITARELAAERRHADGLVAALTYGYGTGGNQQFTLNEGACIEAATTGNPVFVADLEHAVEVAQRFVDGRLVDFATRGSSSVGRAAAFQAACREFEPRLPLQPSRCRPQRCRNPCEQVPASATRIESKRTVEGNAHNIVCIRSHNSWLYAVAAT